VWERNIIEPGKLPLLLCFVALVVTFFLTRTITRLIRADKGPFHDVREGGVHVHHSVPGIILLVTGAVMALVAPAPPGWHAVAGVLVGVGASLVLDEFALILHLEDVYWSAEGRQSVQAVALVAACLACVLIGLSPFGVDDTGGIERGVRLASVASLVVALVAVVVCALKGKYRLALLAVFVPPVALAGAIRLARPGSPWDRRRYREGPTHRRAVERTERFDARWDPRFRRVGDLIAGAPSAAPVEPPH
jgi:hypothetical protein